MNIKEGLASIVYKFFNKKLKGNGVNTQAEPFQKKYENNERLAEKLHKTIIRKFKKRTVLSGSKDNIWGADLADMRLISKFNKGIRFLLCVIDIFSKYAWVVPLKDEKGASIVDAFQKILKESDRKPNKIWVDKGSEFYNNSFKKWLKDNDIEMYSIHNEGKSVVAERFIRTLKTKIYKYMTSISKNVYIDKLDDMVNEYNNTYRRTIKMKPVEVKDNTYIDFKNEVNDKDPKFKVGYHVRTSKYRTWTYVINGLIVKKLLEVFMKKSYKRLISKN